MLVSLYLEMSVRDNCRSQSSLYVHQSKLNNRYLGTKHQTSLTQSCGKETQETLKSNLADEFV